ncbi:glycosyltransferase [Desulfobulbus elongatus]|uniref:glycosyltransferase n=1 Tax=Desulfobulbus elongatus TaxID=53332 RepID=UPI001FE225E9|nr:glycosyltransferase [Desulfobulbus elongatus]
MGEQLPFDRLIQAMDQWAQRTGQEVFAQVGHSDFKPCYIQYKPFLDQAEFGQKMEAAQLIVAHAGMGTIISALERGKPLVVMPRKASLGEHRNEHQSATASRFAALGHVWVVDDEQGLGEALAFFLTGGEPDRSQITRIEPSAELIQAIREFIRSVGHQ